ncbi:MAG: hypothetical protein CL910_08800 [Deltaproteobacteria bacterium]|nr:hypothetical protein [Deltaproteobacteria bacterium]
MFRWVALLLLAVAAGVGWLLAGGAGWLGSSEHRGEVFPKRVAAEILEARTRQQIGDAEALGTESPKQILFGDFHVHTTFSFDAFLMSLPMAGGNGTHPPADACDFARYCSALDFWSINDHAENITPRLWKETVESVRQCNAVAGDPANPDLVTYLGWEWSHIGDRPDNHYGHKNVVLLGTDDEEIPARPISSRSNEQGGIGDIVPLHVRSVLAAVNGERGRDFTRLLREVAGAPPCPTGVPVRELPTDCVESAPTPEELYAKLNDWDLPALVIPHGTAWGIYTPAGSDWAKQLPGHDPKLQRLVEIYSGHGASEVFPRWKEVERRAEGGFRCPEPKDGYLPSCWRSGELIQGRCLELGGAAEECAARAGKARQHYVDGFQGGWLTAPGYSAADWLDSGQCPGCFQPAFNYRPRGSVQYILALRNFDDPAAPRRFAFGFLGSSDNHGARPGTGYKEFARGDMTEGRGGSGERGPSVFGTESAGEPVAESVPFTGDTRNPLGLFESERANAFFVTGGLVAVHSEGRDRQAIWDALQKGEVYATSGPRILLWFELVDEDVLPMGAKTQRNETPRFRARALGSFEPKPGCPDSTVAALGEERIEQLCLGECYHPSDRRRPITRIEVVRIRPQERADEPIEPLVEDAWRVFECPADGQGCAVEFDDPEFTETGRDAVYYVRAIEAPSLAIHGSNPLGCERDESGRCISVSACAGDTPADEDCLAETEARAWSSPIFVDFDRAEPDAAAAMAGGGVPGQL